MDPGNRVGIFALPPVSSFFSLAMIALFFTQSFLFNYDEDVWVSWDKVITDGEFWRLFIAQYFHFTRSHLFWSVVTLMTVGHHLEKKLTKVAMLFLIQLLGTLSNTIFLLLNLLICSGAPLKEMSYGFSPSAYGLRVALAYSQELLNYEAALFYGLFPTVLPLKYAPWQPLLEVVILKICIWEKCVADLISNCLAAIIISLSASIFPREWIFLPEREPDSPNPNNQTDDNLYMDEDSLDSHFASQGVLRAVQIKDAFDANIFEENSSLNIQNILRNPSFRFLLDIELQLQKMKLKNSILRFRRSAT